MLLYGVDLITIMFTVLQILIRILGKLQNHNHNYNYINTIDRNFLRSIFMLSERRLFYGTFRRRNDR